MIHVLILLLMLAVILGFAWYVLTPIGFVVMVVTAIVIAMLLPKDFILNLAKKMYGKE